MGVGEVCLPVPEVAMRYLYLWPALTSLALGCTVNVPQVKVTGEKTALENQIIGTYREIEEDVWMVASVRGAEPGEKIDLSDEKRAVLEAIRNRSFNRDDIDEFKKDGAVGESREGLLEVRPNERMEKDPEYRKLVITILEEENRDRRIIARRVTEVMGAKGPADERTTMAAFARLNREQARPGEWVQQDDGKWVRK